MLEIPQNATKTKKAREHSLCIQRNCVNIFHRRMQLIILIFGILVRRICVNDISCFWCKEIRDSIVWITYRYSSSLFVFSRNILSLIVLICVTYFESFCRLRAFYIPCYSKLLYFQVNTKIKLCVRFVTILVFLINAITLWFNSTRTALHHIAYVAWNCTIILNFFRDFFPRLLH